MAKKLTNEDIVERMYDLVGDEYSKLDDVYINNSTKFSIRHNECGYQYKVIWSNFQKGTRCPKCAGNINYTDIEVTELIKEMTNKEYKKLTVYKNASSKIGIQHNICNHQYMVTWNDFQQGKRCPQCVGERISKAKAFRNSEIETKIHDLVGNEYTKIDKYYKNAFTPFLIEHNLCNHRYLTTWNNFQQGGRCQFCFLSNGEQIINGYLSRFKIKFCNQFIFKDCKHRRPLRFDFGISNDKKEVVALIEYDGIQHFKSKDFFGGEEALAITQLRDQIKNQYCKDNNIPLLRIRYDEDIEEKLIEFLKEQNIIKGE